MTVATVLARTTTTPNHSPTVLHLIDDTTAGGVMRVLDFLTTDARMNATASHVLRQVSRGAAPPAMIEADVIVSHLALNWRSLPALIALRARYADRTLIHVEHSYTEAFEALNVPRQGRFRTLLRTSYALFDRVVAVSAPQGRWLKTCGLVDASRLCVILSCVDLSNMTFLPRPANRPGVIGAIGRLDRQKGFDTLIRAFRHLSAPDIVLTIYGDGAERRALEALALGDRRIKFRGHTAIALAMSEIDAVAMPSRWEACGLVALEARAAGRPLLVAEVDGLRAHVGEGGVIGAPTGSVESLLPALEQLTSQDHAIMPSAEFAAAQMTAFRNGWSDILKDTTRSAGYKAARDLVACPLKSGPP